MPLECLVLEPGLVPYLQAWQLQNDLATRIAAGTHPPTLLLLEHPHTYTFGRRGQPQHLVWDDAELNRRGVSVYWVDRGGDVTYHGPGQLVGYPLLPLATAGLQVTDDQTGRIPQADYVGYVRMLEQVLIVALGRMGVRGRRVEGMTGVWVQREGLSTAEHSWTQMAKVAAIGVKVDARGVTRHGFALNVNPEMSYWQGIIACGLEGATVTSLTQLLPSPPGLPQVQAAVIQAFGEVFAYQMVFPVETKHISSG